MATPADNLQKAVNRAARERQRGLSSLTASSTPADRRKVEDKYTNAITAAEATFTRELAEWARKNKNDKNK